jgi:ferric-dicitrate binding protein FerR (iron transport regulator)
MNCFVAVISARVAKRSRVAILLQNHTLLRLDEATTVTFTEIKPDKPSWLDLLKGAVHFISRTPESLDVTTPFVNAAIEGTEFVVRVEPAEAGIWVFEGQVLARNARGRLMLGSGEAAVTRQGRAPERRLVFKPREAVQ